MQMSEAAHATKNPDPKYPNLTRVEPVSDPFTDALAPRAISLGGPGAGNLPAFTISGHLLGRSVITDTDLTRDEIYEVLDTAVRLKKMRQAGQNHSYLAGKSLGMIFQHPSTRTRVSFEAGMAQLGGQAIFPGAQPLRGRHRRPRRGPRRHRGDRRRIECAGPERPERSLAPHAVAQRSADHAGGPRRAEWAQARVPRRWQ
jgi:hypothetical protein